MAEVSLKMLLLGQDKTASKAIKGVGKTTDETTGKISKMGVVAGIAGTAAGVAAIKFGKDSIRAYSDAQTSQKELADAFSRFPALADTNQKALQNLNSALQKKTKFDDDNIASGQAVLAQFKLTGSQLTEVTPLLLDYASRTGKDIPAAAQDVGKALLGNAKALKNIGIKYTATGDSAKDFTNISALLRTQVGGFAEKEGTTAAGQAEILKNQFGEIEETVGSKLVPALMNLTRGLLDVVGFIGRNSAVIKPLVIVIGGLAAIIWTLVTAQKIWAATQLLLTEGIVANMLAGIAQAATWVAQVAMIYARVAAYGAVIAATAVWTGVQWALNVALNANPLSLIIIGIVALIAVIVIAYKHSQTFRAIVTGAFRAVMAAVAATWGWIKGHWPLLLSVLTGPVGAAVIWIIRHWAAVTKFFRGVPKAIGAAVSAVASTIAAPFISAFNHIADAWNNTVGRLHWSVPGWVPGIGGNSISAPTLPHFAAGAIVNSPTVGLIGEAGPEAIIPLSAGRGGGLGGGDMYVTNNFYGPVDKAAVGKQVVETLVEFQRQQGGRAIPIRVAG